RHGRHRTRGRGVRDPQRREGRPAHRAQRAELLGETVIALSDITLTYPDGEGTITAVNDVSLTIQPGAIAAITGPSGSGKSSLLAVASTLIAPDAGSVMINDVDATALTSKQTATLRRNEIGIVFQQPNLLGSLTALEQLELMDRLDTGRGS